MIDLMFKHFNEIILVRIDGKRITFGNSRQGNKMASIEGLKLVHSGVIKEFPHLKDNPNWRQEAIKEFKKKIDMMMNEEEIAVYLTKDLKNHGYVPKLKQKQGFRIEKIQDGNV